MWSIPQFKNPRTKTWLAAAGLVILAAIGGGVGTGLYIQQHRWKELDKENQQLLTDLGELMVLPSSLPQIYTVLDKDKLAGQPFFALSHNGDRVLLYPQERKAILYRPELHKIVDFSNLVLEPASGSATANSQLAQVKVAIYNGTNTPDLATSMEQLLLARVSNLSITQKQKAARQDYHQTQVVDLTGRDAATAKQLADLIGAQVVALPVGETAPSGVDFLVIVGQPATNPQSNQTQPVKPASTSAAIP